MKKRLVIANWKGYIKREEEAKKFAAHLRKKTRAFPGVTVVLAPSFPLIPAVAEALSARGRSALGGKNSSIKVGAQAVSPFEDVQHTGEVPAALLKDFGVSYVLVGHSERRATGETDEMVRGSFIQAISNKLVPVLCVGERERDLGGNHFAFLERQLIFALKNISKRAPLKLVIAYEPVWAIGKTAADAMRPAELQEMVIFIRKTLASVLPHAVALRTPILYGGSVEGENADVLIEEGGVNGFLVGHASVKLDSFIEILKACQR